MSSVLIKQSVLWGLFLWGVGYVLGIILFPFVPSALIGWIIMPVGIVVTLWVLVKQVRLQSLKEYIYLGLMWVLLAIVCDYLFLVLLFHPADGYYKLDVYLYYLLTFLMPFLAGWWHINHPIQE